MTELHFWSIGQCLILLTLANGVPVIAKKMLGEWLAWPIDGGWLFWDGQLSWVGQRLFAVSC